MIDIAGRVAATHFERLDALQVHLVIGRGLKFDGGADHALILTVDPWISSTEVPKRFARRVPRMLVTRYLRPTAPRKTGRRTTGLKSGESKSKFRGLKNHTTPPAAPRSRIAMAQLVPP